MIETTIVIANNANKKYMLKKLNEEKKLHNFKFYTFNDLKKKLFFNYDSRALEFTMSKYGVSLSVAKVYLDNLYFLSDIDDEKILFLKNLKKELEENNLLIIDELFRKYIKNKKVIISGSEITLEQKKLMDIFNINYEFSNTIECNYIPKVYEARDKYEEVEFVINNICELLYNGVDISKIKIIANNEYNNILKYYFDMYKIPINLKSDSIFYSTFIAQDFLNYYDDLSIQDNINILKEKYDNVNDLITIINKSVLVQNKKLRKEFIIDDLKNSKIQAVKYNKAVEICDIEDVFLEDEYVFLLGFNINAYPKVYKNDNYLSDDIKSKLGLDTSINKNKYEKNKIVYNIRKIKNLIITYKLTDGKSVFYPSLLINELNLEVNKVNINEEVVYSKLNSKLKYAKDLDKI